VNITILGPLEAEANGRSIVPTAGKPRQILALLALNANQVMPVPTLMEELWGEELPRSALTTLQTYILQLRRRLTSAHRPAKDVLATRHGGYSLQISPESVDVFRIERLERQARAAYAAGDLVACAGLLHQALRCWRGQALVDVPAGPLLEIEARRLAEVRLGLLELRIEAELCLGREAQLLTELTGLTARHGLHEGLHAQAMIAHYRCGRQARALEIFHGLRRRLVDELGIEPSTRVQRLHHAILCGDPELESPLSSTVIGGSLVAWD